MHKNNTPNNAPPRSRGSALALSRLAAGVPMPAGATGVTETGKER